MHIYQLQVSSFNLQWKLNVLLKMHFYIFLVILLHGNCVSSVTDNVIIPVPGIKVGVQNQSAKSVQNAKIPPPQPAKDSFRVVLNVRTENPVTSAATDFVSGIERFLQSLSSSSPTKSASSLLFLQNNDQGKVLVPSANSATSNKTSTLKLIDSESARVGQFPYILSIKRDGSHICGGVILDQMHIVTASHCFGGESAADSDLLELSATEYTVTVGEHDLDKMDRNEQNLNVDHICVHPDYDGFQGGNDIAIIRLRRRIRFYGNVQPARLPKSEGVDVEKGTADVAGWGTTGYNIDMEKIRPNILQTTHLFLYPADDCKTFKGDLNSIICAGSDGPNPRDVCAGDSGSPLICSGRVCALVSYGPRCLHDISRRRGVYTRLTYFNEWMSKVASRNARGDQGLCYNSS